MAHFAVDGDVAAALLDDAVDRGQPEARAFACFFGSEERLEDAGEHVRTHATAGVTDGNADVFSRLCFGSVLAVLGIKMGASDIESEPSAAGNGVERSDDLQQLLRRLQDPVKGTQYFLPLGASE